MPYQPVKTLYSEKFSCGILVRWQGGYNRGVLSPERWQQINQLFYDALAQPTATRVAFLAEACGADEELRQEVLTLPAADGKAAPLVERPLGAVALAGTLHCRLGQALSPCAQCYNRRGLNSAQAIFPFYNVAFTGWCL